MTSSEMFVFEGRVQMIISTCIIVTCGYYYFLEGHGDVEEIPSANVFAMNALAIVTWVYHYCANDDLPDGLTVP